jgi:hypothetical protein
MIRLCENPDKNSILRLGQLENPLHLACKIFYTVGILWVRFNILPSRVVASKPLPAQPQENTEEQAEVQVEFPGLTGWRTDL